MFGWILERWEKKADWKETESADSEGKQFRAMSPTFLETRFFFFRLLLLSIINYFFLTSNFFFFTSAGLDGQSSGTLLVQCIYDPLSLEGFLLVQHTAATQVWLYTCIHPNREEAIALGSRTLSQCLLSQIEYIAESIKINTRSYDRGNAEFQPVK